MGDISTTVRQKGALAAADQTVTGDGGFKTVRSAVCRYRHSDLDVTTHETRLSRRHETVQRVLRRVFSLRVSVSWPAYLATAATALTLLFLARPSWRPDQTIACTLPGCEQGALIAVADLWLAVFGVIGGVVAAVSVNLAIKSVRTRSKALSDLRRTGLSIRHKRMIYPGGGQFRFSLGEEGIEVESLTRTLSFKWVGVDMARLKKLNPALAQLFARSAPDDVPLEEVERRARTDQDLSDFLRDAAQWATGVRYLELPLIVSDQTIEAVRDQEEKERNAPKPGAPATRRARPHETVATSTVDWIEYLKIPRHFFDGHQDASTWERWVKLTVYMLYRHRMD